MKNEPIEIRFWQKVSKTDSCWVWTGLKQKAGYGLIQEGGKNGGKRITASRLSYKLAYGDFDQSLKVCHTCDNPSCVRPDHLFLGTQADNMRDCSLKKRTNSEKIAKPFTFISPDGSIVEGKNLKQFCKDLGLNQGAMWSVLNGKIRYHKGYTKAS